MAIITLRAKQNIDIKWIAISTDDTLTYYEAKFSVCAKNSILLTTSISFNSQPLHSHICYPGSQKQS